MQRDGDELLLSPSDLTAYLACRHLTSLQLEVVRRQRERPRIREPLAELVREKGELHEQRYLEHLRADGREIVEIELPEGDDGFEQAHAATLEAMRAGADVIYQATFVREGWRGRADFVVRSSEPSALGPWSYEPYDTKLARTAKPAAGPAACLVRGRDRDDSGSQFSDRYLESLRDDPLTPQARSQHRNVLLAASIAILVVQLNLVPTRISALGVDLETDDRRTIRVALLLAVIYFIVSFLAAAIGDVVLWRQAHGEARDARDTTAQNIEKFRARIEEVRAKEDADRERREREGGPRRTSRADLNAAIADLLDAERRHTLYRVLVPTGVVRALIDFVVPVVVAGIAIVMLAFSL